MANKKISELQSRTPALSDLMLVGDPSSGYSYKCTVTALATIIETDIADGYVTIGTTQTISGAKTFSNNLTLTSVANATTTQTKFLTLNASNVVNYRTGAEVLADIGGASSSSISGTTNYVAKFTSSSAIGNSQIFDNGTNVGIGTNTPTRTLDVNGIITTNNNLELTSSTPTILWTTSNLRFYNNTNGIVATISSAGQLTLSSIPNATIDTDKFLVSDSGVLKYRTGAELLSDIGGASAALYVPYTGATTNVNLGTRTITANGVYSTEGIYVANTYGLYGRNAANNAYNLLVGITGQDKVYIDGSGSGTIMNGTLTLSVINNATIDTDTFLVADSGVIKYRTGSQLLSDIGGQAALTNPVTGTGTTNYIPKFTSSSAIGNSVIYEDASGDIGIGTTSPSSIRLNVLARSGYEDVAYFGTAGTNIMARINLLPTGTAVGAINSSANGFAFQVAGSERMRLDASGNLGLGISAPNELLSLNATGNVNIHLTNATSGTTTNDGFKVGFNTSLNAYLLNKEAGSILFYTSDALRATLDASGNLGLGVTPSAFATYKAFQIGAYSSLVGQHNDTRTWLSNNAYFDGTNWKYIVTAAGVQYNLYDGEHRWLIAPSGTAGNAISFTQAMTLDASGRLGIGTTSPSARLAVHKSESGAGAGAVLRLENTGTNYTSTMILTDGTTNDALISYLGATQSLGFGVGATANKMVITSGGNVGIGTSSPGSLLDVVTSTAYDGVIRVRSTGTNTPIVAMGVDAVASPDGYVGTQNNVPFGIRTNDVNRIWVTTGGNVGIGTTSPNAKLEVNGNTISSNFYIPAGSAGTYGLADLSAAIQTYSGSVSPTNSLLFYTSGSERMRITSGGNLLLGTTTSYSRLTISNGSSTRSGITISDGNTASLMMFAGASADAVIAIDANNLAFKTGATVGQDNGSERMRITSGGNVGIGTTSPAAVLDVVGSSGIRVNEDGAGTKVIQIRSDFAGVDPAINVSTNNALLLQTNNTERMRITSGGELLINTTSDAGDYKLQVNGNGLFTSSSNGYLTLNAVNSGGNEAGLFFQIGGSNKWEQYTAANDTRMLWYSYAAGNTPMTITTDGNLTLTGSIKTAAPSGGTAQAWKLGSKVTAAALTMNITDYIEVEVNGVAYKLALIN